MLLSQNYKREKVVITVDSDMLWLFTDCVVSCVWKGVCDSWCFPAIAFGVENMATAMDEDLEDELDEKEEKSMMCQPGMHKWKLDQCMVCTVCGDCSGYGASCVSSGRPDRVPGGWEKPHTHTHTNTNRVMITHSIRHVYTDHDYPAIDNIQNKKLLKQYVFWST